MEEDPRCQSRTATYKQAATRADPAHTQNQPIVEVSELELQGSGEGILRVGGEVLREEAEGEGKGRARLGSNPTD